MAEYTPRPIDTSRVKLSKGLRELQEQLAENNHDVWAIQRMKEGWKYGANRDDKEKLHPCLVPYAELPEGEKNYDRNTALEAIKAIMALGYRIDSRYGELFEIEIEGWCYGLAKYPGERSPGLIHRVVREISPVFQQAIEHEYEFDIFAVADKISQAARYLIDQREIVFCILAGLPNPSALDENARLVLHKIVRKANQKYPGALERLEKKWAWEDRERHGGEPEHTATPAETQTSNEFRPVVFLSHSSSDKEFVRRIYDRLTGTIADVWLDELSMNPGESLDLRITPQIRMSSHLLFVASKASVCSDWARHEVKIAIDADNTLVVPLLLETCSLPVELAGLAHVDFRQAERFEESLSKLITILQHRPDTAALLMQEKLRPGDPKGLGGTLAPLPVRDTTGWTPDDFAQAAEVIVKDQLGYAAASPSARNWWDAFVKENPHQTPLVLRLADELSRRSTTIQEYFEAYVYSNTDNIQGNLHYLDYRRCKLEADKRYAAERAKAQAAVSEAAPAANR